MKRLIFAALFILGTAAAGSAQERPNRDKKTPEQRAQLMTDSYNKKLSLSEKQRSEIYKINLERAKNMEKLHKSSKASHEKDLAKSKKLHQASENKINKVLNEQQRKTYASMKSHKMEKAKGHKTRTGRPDRQRNSR